MNRKNINTISNKIRKIGLMVAYITQKIDNNQEIKRFMRYMTVNPLSSRGKDQNGNVVNQVDLNKSLAINSDEGIKCLYTMGFKEDMIDEARPLIFIHSYNGKFGDTIGNINIAVDIIVPSHYNELKYMEEKRSTEIACKIADELDGITIDEDEWVDKLGNLNIKLATYSEHRLSKSGNAILFSMDFKITTPVTRLDKNGYI